MRIGEGDSEVLVAMPRRRLGKALRRSCVLGFGFCLAATSGAIVWDATQPWRNPMESALTAASTVKPNTPEASGVAVRMLQLLRPGIEAIEAMDQRGDQAAAKARSTMVHWLARAGESDITVEQIRTRYAKMPAADFLSWLRDALK